MSLYLGILVFSRRNGFYKKSQKSRLKNTSIEHMLAYSIYLKENVEKLLKLYENFLFLRALHELMDMYPINPRF